MNNQLNLRDLLNNSISKAYQDKVFWYAHHIAIDKNCIDIYLDSLDCLVASDEIADELGLKAISKIASLNQKDTVRHHPTLVSSGTFLWINDKLLVTQRTANAKFDPLFWTAPQGRCDLTPLQTAYKETAEEIHSFLVESDELCMPKPTIKYLHNKVVKAYSVEIGTPNLIPNIELITVNTWIDNVLKESTKMWYCFSKEVNTLELKIPIYSYIEEALYFKNAEYNSPACLMSIDELNQMNVVPSVRQLIKELLCQKRCQKRCQSF